MSDAYTPSMDEARRFYVFGRLARKAKWGRGLHDEFRRMLAAHDATVRAGTTRRRKS
jgi:hypothetical protein